MRVIKADDLLSMISSKKGMIGACGLRRFVEVMAIDVPEIIHCKDCKYWVRDGNESFGYAMFCECNCSLGGQGIKKPTDFCNYAERKEQ